MRDRHEMDSWCAIALEATVAVAIGVGAAHAGNDKTERTACFERSYDKRHLAKNPDQKVVKIRWQLTREADNAVSHQLRVRVRGDKRWYELTGHCHKGTLAGKKLRCSADGDRGDLRSRPKRKKLLLGSKDGWSMWRVGAEEGDDSDMFVKPDTYLLSPCRKR